jgi:outer membrane receptor protein involved in Fe transport
MTKSFWLLSAGIAAITAPASAQETGHANATGSGQTGQVSAEDRAAGAANQADTTASGPEQGEIIVTATRRASPLSDVPVAVSAITAETMQNSGASDLRQLNQVTPSLYVSSTSSEAGAGGAGIRGIRTVGDNPGLESSVATFIDGVYRSRSGVGLTELGPVERVEVLRGPQGTLFGRNASAGLINVVTARPRFETQGYAEASYGNYDFMRVGAGFNAPIGETVAARIDGVYVKRDGFLKDVISDRDFNDRDRYLLRGKLLFEPNSNLSVLLIGDYSKRDEECCAATYLPTRDVTRAADGSLVSGPSSIANLIRTTTSVVPGSGLGRVLEDTYARQVAITPGRDFRSDVEDWGASAEVNYDFGGATLTSITAYRHYDLQRGLDADFNNLDILARPSDGRFFNKFRTFTQEARLQGSSFDGVLDWLVGGYYANETLKTADNITYGADYNQFSAGRVGLLFAPVNPALAGAFRQLGFQNLNTFASTFASAQLATIPTVPAAARPAIAAAIASRVQNTPLSGGGVDDRYEQKSRNFALFTHNIINVTDKLAVTLGLRYTNERKRLEADLNSTSNCGTFVNNINALRALAAAATAPGAPSAVPGLPAALNPAVAGVAAGLANTVFAPLAPLACVINSVNGDFESRKKESEWSGTAVVSYKVSPDLMTYASFSRGYKAGGFNLDRAPLFSPVTLASTTNLDVLKFDPEKVDAYEVGAKFDGRKIDINVAAFYQMFKTFQLNTFDGTNFFVTDVRGCKDDLGTTDEDITPGNSICQNTRSGVTSKGIEIESFIYPSRDFTVAAGVTIAKTEYYKDLAGTPSFYQPANGNSLIPPLFLLPGQQLSNAPEYVVTGSATWTPPVGNNLRGLLYTDFRYQSEFNTGSDLFVEKEQQGVMVVNARAGIGAEDRRWSVELWAQNLFDVNYKQVAFNATLQGSNTSLAQTQRFGTPGTQLFGAFLAEPRTYGVTVRTRF